MTIRTFLDEAWNCCVERCYLSVTQSVHRLPFVSCQSWHRMSYCLKRKRCDLLSHAHQPSFWTVRTSQQLQTFVSATKPSALSRKRMSSDAHEIRPQLVIPSYVMKMARFVVKIMSESFRARHSDRQMCHLVLVSSQQRAKCPSSPSVHGQ